MESLMYTYKERLEDVFVDVSDEWKWWIVATWNCKFVFKIMIMWETFVGKKETMLVRNVKVYQTLLVRKVKSKKLCLLI